VTAPSNTAYPHDTAAQTARARGYLPIERYGLIGDMHTAALVGLDGSIDWCCLPRFDAPSAFARLLDAERGGFWQIGPADTDAVARQFYLPETNVLVTRFLGDHGAGEVVDYMPVPAGERRAIHRTVRSIRGTARFRMTCCPAFDYARADHALQLTDAGATFRSEDLRLDLAATVPLECLGDERARGVACDFALEEGEAVTFVLLEAAADAPPCEPLSNEAAEQALEETVRYWRSWVGGCSYTGRWREAVHRSALTLKLLTYAPTGAIIAAVTTSLPEAVGGERNWDYRYTWIRDAAFTLYGLLRIGFTEEAAAFMGFLEQLCTREDDEGRPLQSMYGIDGRRELTEDSLDHLDGYRGSRPVRIGNAAYDQLQLDIYGELLDAVYLYNKHGTAISFELWRSVRLFVDWVCDHWHLEDEGVWEVRGGRRHFTYSKVMCWVAVDRGLRLAEKRSLPADRPRWLRVRDEIYAAIMTRGWSEERQAFVQAFDGDALDAANLIMPLVFFAAPTDPRMLATLDATLRPPSEGGLTAGGLVHRYNADETDDGVGGVEGTFNICTFWLVEALTRAGRTDAARLEEARLHFEQMLGFSNHLGLYAEETGRRGEALGNTPQAFTHLALISAAYNLDRALDGR